MNVLKQLEHEGVPFEHSTHPVAYTARQLAALENVSPWNVAKPVLVMADQRYVVCVVPAAKRLNLRAVTDALCAEKVRLAFEEELAALFPDCEVGAEPPIGSVFGLETLVDYALMKDPEIVFQAGKHTESVRMKTEDFERVANPMYGEIGTD